MYNLNEFWNSIHEGNRGKMGRAESLGKVRLLEAAVLKKKYLKDIKKVIDWGCGIGHLSKDLIEKYKWETILCDISQKSINSCKEYLKEHDKSVIKYIHLPNDTKKVNIRNKVDLLLCHSVVWHMPSLDYFLDLLEVWYKMNVKYYIMNVKHGKRTLIKDDNYEKNYHRVLEFSKEDLDNIFDKKKFKILEYGITNTDTGYYLLKKH